MLAMLVGYLFMSMFQRGNLNLMDKKSKGIRINDTLTAPLFLSFHNSLANANTSFARFHQ